MYFKCICLNPAGRSGPIYKYIKNTSKCNLNVNSVEIYLNVNHCIQNSIEMWSILNASNDICLLYFSTGINVFKMYLDLKRVKPGF